MTLAKAGFLCHGSRLVRQPQHVLIDMAYKAENCQSDVKLIDAYSLHLHSVVSCIKQTHPFGSHQVSVYLLSDFKQQFASSGSTFGLQTIRDQSTICLLLATAK